MSVTRRVLTAVAIVLVPFCLNQCRMQSQIDTDTSAPAGYSPQGGNLVPNAGFEEMGEGGLPKQWQLMPNREGHGAVMLDTKSHSGKFSVKLSPNRKNTAEGFGIFTKLDADQLRGKEVVISGFARLEGMGENPAGLMLQTDRRNWLVFPQAVQGSFFPFSQKFQVSTSINEAYLFIIAGGTTGSVWVDDLTVTTNSGGASAAASSQAAKPLPSSGDPYVRKINTPGWQDSAFITPDGSELYFAYVPYTNQDLRSILLGRLTRQAVKTRGPIRPDTYSDVEFETYKAKRTNDNRWSAPVRVQVDGVSSFFAAKLSSDGKEMYYVIRDYPGGRGSGDIYVSKRLGDNRWSAPQNLGPNVNTEENEETPCVSADGNTLYFARNKGDALGFRLMFSRRVNGQWTQAQPMPYPLNERNPQRTANHQPFITADGREFYFTRIQQLYRSVKQSDGNWGTPSKVFPNLPLSGHASVTVDGKYLYFLSAKDEQSIARENWTIWYAEKKSDGGWGTAKPVD